MRKLVAQALTLLSAFLCLQVIAAPVPKPSAEHQKQLVDAEELLHQRAKARDQGNDAEAEKLGNQFEAAVKKMAPNLVSIQPEETATPKGYTKLTMNLEKANFGAIRFRVPEGKGKWNLDWEFVYAKGAGPKLWNIEAVDGKMTGSSVVSSTGNWQEDFADLPAKNNRYTQQFSNGEFNSGGEYVIWFTFADEKPVELFVRIGVTPAK